MPSSNTKPGNSSRKRKNIDSVDQPSLPSSASKAPNPAPYAKHLQLTPSLHRPHCLARERLRIWTPVSPRNTLDANGTPTNLSQSDLTRIADVLTHAWAESTREAYGTGLLVFHVFCDAKSVPDTQRAPASPILLQSFLSTIAGSYSGSTVSNYFHGVRAWHIIHGVSWLIDKLQMDALLKAASTLTPASSKKKQRLPWTIEFILAILAQLNPTDPLHVAVEGCLLTVFFTAARLGEFTIPTLKSFNASRHVKPSDIFTDTDRNGLKLTGFHLPVTKSGGPEDVSFSAQTGRIDPESALRRHLTINNPPTNGPLFAYVVNGSHRGLTKRKFLEVTTKAAKAAGLDPLQGHGIRIGATLEYLLRGIPFDVMKVKGCWASDAFLLYLRKHAQILAPYMQAVPVVHEAFVRYSMPPVR